ncbi:HpcH/HpaI aldolase family protein [Oceaniglobus ichthyenteri]|uniref:HpcH/HpaI aldolase family protein n=1 Tax=Oceaniglobus ichthyenteri TaxID=2136177 RepID=UPI000D3D0F83|nr:HpcH/HpaI aldolase/citrate lyase family protein [Oceaniglobus ichthyenteri]
MPAPKNRLKHALSEGRLQTGLWMAFAHPTAAEIAARAGFDWCLIDGEHGPNDVPLILAQCQAMSGGTASIVARVPVADVRIMKQMLDIGIQSILVPMINTAQEAAEMVRAVRYPPEGIRGVGAVQSRATGFGEFTDYLATAGDEICLMVQVETRQAIENIEEIAAVPGVDCVFVGPGDLAADMGHLGNMAHPDVVAEIENAAVKIRAAGKAAGIVTFDKVKMVEYAEMGFNFLGVGGDIACYAHAVRSLAKTAKDLSR